MSKDLNVGLIGYKFMGKAHSNGYRKVNMFFDPGAQVHMKAICGRDEEWVKKSADTFGWEGYETSWEKMVARPDLDIIDITTPSNFHKQIAIEAAKNGKHIFCEKPLAINLQDAREMLQAAEQNGVKHQIGFNYRFVPAIQLIKKMIDQGKLGKIYHFRGFFLQDFVLDPSFPLVWRLDKSVAGSGSLGDLGAHVIDCARYLVGEFDEVIGMSETFVKERPIVEKMEGLSAQAKADSAMGKVTVDDATLLLARFKNGALGSIEATRFAGGHKNDMYFEINGSKGSVKFYFERMNELHYLNNEDEAGLQGYRLIQVSEDIHPYMDAWWPAGHVIGYEHTFVHQFYEFIKAIVNDTPTTPNFTDGVACCQILEAVEKSIEERRWIQVDSL
ncbi:MAG: Gfo/Idh/MocA family oxidoreductase [Oscillospiraceae bacterium]|jgi:predicted dehydrogenase|nr:Gfo/Idh/MocA family oxidoreductase [Oscillospiraceae bacterium]